MNPRYVMINFQVRSQQETLVVKFNWRCSRTEPIFVKRKNFRVDAGCRHGLSTHVTRSRISSSERTPYGDPPSGAWTSACQAASARRPAQNCRGRARKTSREHLNLTVPQSAEFFFLSTTIDVSAGARVHFRVGSTFKNEKHMTDN